jgi:hypothetical protein
VSTAVPFLDVVDPGFWVDSDEVDRDDVGDGAGVATGTQPDQLRSLQQPQRSVFVRRVVGDRDLRSVTEIREMLDRLRVDPHRDEDRLADRDQLVAVRLDLVVEVRRVLNSGLPSNSLTLRKLEVNRRGRVPSIESVRGGEER